MNRKESPDFQTFTRLQEFKRQWLNAHPEYETIIEEAEPIAKKTFQRLSKKPTSEEKWTNNLFLTTTSDPLLGFPQNSFEENGCLILDKEFLNKLGISSSFGIFIPVDSQDLADFAKSTFHEMYHLSISQEERFSSYLEESLVSYLAISSSVYLGKKMGSREIEAVTLDPIDIVFSSLIDKFATTTNPHAEKEWAKVYEDIIDKAFGAIVINHEQEYFQELMERTFNMSASTKILLFYLTSGIETFYKKNPYNQNPDEGYRLTLDLYNRISGNKMKAWEDFGNSNNANRPLVALYLPERTIALRPPAL